MSPPPERISSTSTVAVPAFVDPRDESSDAYGSDHRGDSRERQLNPHGPRARDPAAAVTLADVNVPAGLGSPPGATDWWPIPPISAHWRPDGVVGSATTRGLDDAQPSAEAATAPGAAQAVAAQALALLTPLSAIDPAGAPPCRWKNGHIAMYLTSLKNSYEQSGKGGLYSSCVGEFNKFAAYLEQRGDGAYSFEQVMRDLKEGDALATHPKVLEFKRSVHGGVGFMRLGARAQAFDELQAKLAAVLAAAPPPAPLLTDETERKGTNRELLDRAKQKGLSRYRLSMMNRWAWNPGDLEALLLDATPGLQQMRVLELIGAPFTASSLTLRAEAAAVLEFRRCFGWDDLAPFRPLPRAGAWDAPS